MFCREHVAQLRDRHQELEQVGAHVAAVGLGDRAYARAFRGEAAIPFPLFVDERREAYRAAGLNRASLLHLLRRGNAEARARARAAGHRQQRLGRDPFQLGGSFVFGPGDVVLYAHRSETFGDHAPIEDLMEAVRAVASP